MYACTHFYLDDISKDGSDQLSPLGSGRFSGFLILLRSGCYGSVDFFSGQQILTSGLVRVKYFLNHINLNKIRGLVPLKT